MMAATFHLIDLGNYQCSAVTASYWMQSTKGDVAAICKRVPSKQFLLLPFPLLHAPHLDVVEESQRICRYQLGFHGISSVWAWLRPFPSKRNLQSGQNLKEASKNQILFRLISLRSSLLPADSFHKRRDSGANVQTAENRRESPVQQNDFDSSSNVNKLELVINAFVKCYQLNSTNCQPKFQHDEFHQLFHHLSAERLATSCSLFQSDFVSHRRRRRRPPHFMKLICIQPTPASSQSDWTASRDFGRLQPKFEMSTSVKQRPPPKKKKKKRKENVSNQTLDKESSSRIQRCLNSPKTMTQHPASVLIIIKNHREGYATLTSLWKSTGNVKVFLC